MYSGTNPKAVVPGTAYKYNPFFDNLHRNNIAALIFSMALTRDSECTSEGGALSLGGILDVPYAPSWISTPILPIEINQTSGEIDHQFYTVTVDGFSISSDQGAQSASIPDARQNPHKTALRGPIDVGNTNSSVVNDIVDSGTTLVYLRDDLAAAVAAAFYPPDAVHRDTDLFTVPCGAKPPVFGASIGGKVFNANPGDMLLQLSADTCLRDLQYNQGEL
jgi:hypothetical protein